MGKAPDADDALVTSLAEANAIITDLRAQIASLTKAKPPRLTGRSKDELKQIASDEQVDVTDEMTANDIIAAIEAKREGAAS